MSCASCAVSVETILSSREGISKAAVSFPNHSVQVEYNPEKITPQQMRSALQEVGYDLLVDETEEGREKLEAVQKEELKRLRIRTVAAIVLSAPLVVAGMFFMDLPYINYWMWLLASPVVLWLGRDFFINAWKQARHRRANMDTLVALSTLRTTPSSVVSRVVVVVQSTPAPVVDVVVLLRTPPRIGEVECSVVVDVVGAC